MLFKPYRQSYNEKFTANVMFQSVLETSLTLVTLATLLSSVSAQVNSEIDQFEDLLAVDSFANEVWRANRPSIELMMFSCR